MEGPPPKLRHLLLPGGEGCLVNCLHCGCINVVPAALERKGHGFGGCSGCGLGLDRASSVTQAEGFDRAVALKDKLVQ